jgi:hypothetical protein
MAYLSDDDEQAQQDASKGQDSFDLSAPVSSTGGDTSDAQSQQNAGSYDQSYGGSTSTPTKQASTDTTGNNSTGLSSSTPGGGFVNFDSFENANPDQSKTISAAGSSLVGGETNNFNSQTSTNPDSGFSTDPTGAPGWEGGTYERPVTSLTPGVGGGSAPSDPIGMGLDGAPAGTPPTVSGLASGGTPSDLDTLGGWVGERYTAPTYDYTPSTDWQTYAPELSETPILGGQENPSVVDYLARGSIAAGNYTTGDRALDNAIVGGNAADQAAITGNGQKFGQFLTDVGITLGSLNNRANYDTNAAPIIGTDTAGALGNLSTGIMTAAGAVAAGNNSSTSNNDDQAVQSFKTWYNGPDGPSHGGVWNGTTTAATPETPEQALTPAQATELNNIATAEGMTPPYPNGAPSGGYVPPSTGGSGIAAPPPADPGISNQLQNGPMNGGTTNQQVTTGTAYNMIGDGQTPNVGDLDWETPQEMTVQSVMNPGQAASLPPVTQSGLQSALSQLEGVLAGEQAQPLGGTLTAQVKAANVAIIQKEIGAIQGALQGMSPQSPYDYGISLGMTPQQLQAMGIDPPAPSPTYGPLNPGPGPQVWGPT